MGEPAAPLKCKVERKPQLHYISLTLIPLTKGHYKLSKVNLAFGLAWLHKRNGCDQSAELIGSGTTVKPLGSYKGRELSWVTVKRPSCSAVKGRWEFIIAQLFRASWAVRASQRNAINRCSHIFFPPPKCKPMRNSPKSHDENVFFFFLKTTSIMSSCLHFLH